jgi:hypothetical protein
MLQYVGVSLLFLMNQPTCLWLYKIQIGKLQWMRRLVPLPKNKTLHLVPAHGGKNIIDSRWIYKVKRKAWFHS